MARFERAKGYMKEANEAYENNNIDESIVKYKMARGELRNIDIPGYQKDREKNPHSRFVNRALADAHFLITQCTYNLIIFNKNKFKNILNSVPVNFDELQVLHDEIISLTNEIIKDIETAHNYMSALKDIVNKKDLIEEINKFCPDVNEFFKEQMKSLIADYWNFALETKNDLITSFTVDTPLSDIKEGFRKFKKSINSCIKLAEITSDFDTVKSANVLKANFYERIADQIFDKLKLKKVSISERYNQTKVLFNLYEKAIDLKDQFGVKDGRLELIKSLLYCSIYFGREYFEVGKNILGIDFIKKAVALYGKYNLESLKTTNPKTYIEILELMTEYHYMLSEFTTVNYQELISYKDKTDAEYKKKLALHNENLQKSHNELLKVISCVDLILAIYKNLSEDDKKEVVKSIEVVHGFYCFAHFKVFINDMILKNFSIEKARIVLNAIAEYHSLSSEAWRFGHAATNHILVQDLIKLAKDFGDKNSKKHNNILRDPSMMRCLDHRKRTNSQIMMMPDAKDASNQLFIFSKQIRDYLDSISSSVFSEDSLLEAGQPKYTLILPYILNKMVSCFNSDDVCRLEDGSIYDFGKKNKDALKKLMIMLTKSEHVRNIVNKSWLKQKKDVSERMQAIREFHIEKVKILSSPPLTPVSGKDGVDFDRAFDALDDSNPNKEKLIFSKSQKPNASKKRKRVSFYMENGLGSSSEDIDISDDEDDNDTPRKKQKTKK